MTSTNHDISVLNGLIKTTLDSQKGFLDAAVKAENTHFSSYFASYAHDRSQVAAELQLEVSRLGGRPEEDGSLLGAAHRTFMNLAEKFSGDDDKAIVDEVERGEDHIKAKFEAAIEDSDLSPSVRAVIGKAFQSVRAGHDRVRDLKHLLEPS
jgi:uncharacterized protein (TIGR02284 family)